MNVNLRVISIVDKLINRGINPISVDQGSNFTDPAIWITGSIYIQVGKDYVVVFRSRHNDMATYNCSYNIRDIIFKLKQAIEEGKQNG